jgi:hypothetical protein
LDLVGCSNPGDYGKAKVEAELERILGLAEVTLTRNADGSYSGTGRAANGTKYTLKVTQNPQKKELLYSAVSDKGEEKKGGIVQP